MNTLALPPLYRPWIDEVLGQPVYSEPRATCDNCAMCSYTERPAIHDHHLNPNVKCCAYHPSIPNYLVGAILSDDDAQFVDGKAQFVRGALAGVITPMGTEARYWTKIFYKLKPFGKYEQLLCPFYVHLGGKCAIWKYRNALCSTYFCKHERGAIGSSFWRKLDNMLSAAESALSGHCAQKLQVIIPKNPADIREATWGNWTFREADFFMGCWQMVQPLTWNEVLKIGGSQLELLANELKSRFAALQSNTLPEALRVKDFTAEDVGEGMARIWSYSLYNSIDLPREIVDVLNYFDGRPVSEVVKQIEKEKAIRIDTDSLHKMTDYEILVPVSSDQNKIP